MKKSFMSITVLVVLISMVAMLLCGSVANAQTKSKFIYDKKENSETVFTLDESGRYLTPKLKYEFQKDENGLVTSKTAYRWNGGQEEWMPYYQITFTENSGSLTAQYALWNANSNSFSANIQKAVYANGSGHDLIIYHAYLWNQTTGDWDLSHQILSQHYLASAQ